MWYAFAFFVLSYLFFMGFDYGVTEMRHTLDKKPEKFNKRKAVFQSLFWPARVKQFIKLFM